MAARLQAVHRVRALINTRFNVRGEPIVCARFDAYRCFIATDMNWLFIGDYAFIKGEQPHPESKSKWAKTFNEG